MRGARPFETGAVGTLSYEMARHLERLPLKTEPDEARVMLFPAIARLDRKTGRAELCALIPAGREAKTAERRARALAARLATAPLRDGTFLLSSAEPKAARGAGFYTRGVRSLKENIGAGDIFQAVLSESFSAPYAGEPLALLAKLRAQGPCPYLYYLRDGETHFVGASPERLVRVLDGAARNCPIAGTRPRGKTAAGDRALERELRADPKERAEHLMLVDLGRNDLGPRLRAGLRAREDAHGHAALSPCHAHRREVDGRLDAGKTAWTRWAPASRPAPSAARPRCARWSCSRSSRKRARLLWGSHRPA